MFSFAKKLLLTAALAITAIPALADPPFFNPVTNGVSSIYTPGNPVVGGPVGVLFPFTGWISTTTLTTVPGSQPLSVGQTILGPNVTAGTTVTAVVSQTPGQAWTYTVNNSQTIGSSTAPASLTTAQPSFTFSGSVSGFVMTVNTPTSATTPVVPNGAVITGTGVTANSAVTAYLGNNNYQLSQTSASTGSETLTATLVKSNTIMDSDDMVRPVVASGGCTSPAFSADSNPYSWKLTIGTACTGVSTFTLTLPAAAHTWSCWSNNLTNSATSSIVQSGPTTQSTTSAVFTNYVRTTGVAGDLTASGVVYGGCIPH